ncbi:MAG: hypothetical protein ACPL1B_10170, partial [Thermoprotei archaeon]
SGDNDNTVVVNSDLSKPLTIKFRNANKIVLNIPMFDNTVIEMDGMISPVVGIPQYKYSTRALLLPNNTSYYDAFFNGRDHQSVLGVAGFDLFECNSYSDISFHTEAFYQSDRRFTYTSFYTARGLYKYGNSVSSEYSIIELNRTSNDLSSNGIGIGVGAGSGKDVWLLSYLYTSDTKQLIPWSILGTLVLGKTIHNGYITLRRRAL